VSTLAAALVVVAWLATYTLHSTIALGAAALVAWRCGERHAWRELAWKAALVAGVLTTTGQLAAGVVPLGGRWSLPDVSSTDPLARNGDPTGISTSTVDIPHPIPAGEPDQGEPPAASERSATPTAPPPSPISPEPVDRGAGSPPGIFATSWPLVALALWLGGAVVGMGDLLALSLRLRRLLRDRRPIADGDLLAALETLAPPGGRRLRLSVSDSCPVPLALRGAEIVLPRRFVDSLGPDEQRAGVAHEVAHLLRRDPEWQLVALALERLFWFQPLHRVARRGVCECAEYLCDEWSARKTGSPLALARCLEAAARWLQREAMASTPAASPMARPGSPVVRRVARVLAGTPASRRPSLAWVLPPLIGLAAAAPTICVAALAADSAGSGGRIERGPRHYNFVSGSFDDGSELLPRWRASDLDHARARLDLARPSAPAAPLRQRWQWALDTAGDRRLRDFWVVYTFVTPWHARDLMLGDSDGLSLVQVGDAAKWTGPTLLDLLDGPPRPVPSGTVGVLAHYHGTELDRGVYRNARIPFDFGRTPVFWLGVAAEEESLAQMGRLFDASGDDELRTLWIECGSLHPTTDLVIPFLRRFLDRRHSVKVRSEAAEGFDHHPDPRSVRILLDLAGSDPASDVRAEAAETIGELPIPEAIPALLELARHAVDGRTSAEAAEGLGEQPAARAIPAIRDLLADPNVLDDTLAEAVEALSSFPHERAAVDLLVRTAREHSQYRVRMEAAETLAEVPGTLDELVDLAWHSDAGDVRQEAVESLGEVDAPGAFEALEKILWEHPDREAQREAVETLASLHDRRVVALLSRAAREHPDGDVREEARDALGEPKKDHDED
jgi:HEAT repeat protein